MKKQEKIEKLEDLLEWQMTWMFMLLGIWIGSGFELGYFILWLFNYIPFSYLDKKIKNSRH